MHLWTVEFVTTLRFSTRTGWLWVSRKQKTTSMVQQDREKLCRTKQYRIVSWIGELVSFLHHRTKRTMRTTIQSSIDSIMADNVAQLLDRLPRPFSRCYHRVTSRAPASTDQLLLTTKLMTTSAILGKTTDQPILHHYCYGFIIVL